MKTEIRNGQPFTGAAGSAYSRWSKQAQLNRQEKLVSVLWGFAYDLQHEPHNCKSADGTSVNLEAVGRAKDMILDIFCQRPQEVH